MVIVICIFIFWLNQDSMAGWYALGVAFFAAIGTFLFVRTDAPYGVPFAVLVSLLMLLMTLGL